MVKLLSFLFTCRTPAPALQMHAGLCTPSTQQGALLLGSVALLSVCSIDIRIPKDSFVIVFVPVWPAMVGNKVVILCAFKAEACLLAWMHIILCKFRNLVVVDHPFAQEDIQAVLGAYKRNRALCEH